MHLVRIREAGSRTDATFERPIALPIEHDGDFRANLGTHDPLADARQFVAERRSLLEHAGIFGAIVRDDRAMEAFAAADGLLHLEELHGVGTMRHGLPAEFSHFTGALDLAEREPVLLVRSLLHEHERLVAADAAHEVVAHGGEARRSVHARVVVPADHVHLLGPFKVVEILERAHEVGGDRRDGIVFTDRVTFVLVACELRLALEATIVHLQAGDHAFGVADAIAIADGWHHVGPFGDGVAPEVGAPRLVERFDGAILGLEPCAEGFRTLVAIAQAAASAVFVAHMPVHQTRSAGVAFGHMCGERAGRFAEVRRGRAEVVSASEHVASAVLFGADYFRVQAHHPAGQGRGAGGHHDVEIVFDEQRNDLVEHGEVVAVFGRLQQRPREHVDGDFVDMGVFEHFDVMLPSLLRPLFRVPIAAEQEVVINRLHLVLLLQTESCMCSLGNSCRYSSATPLPA